MQVLFALRWKAAALMLLAILSTSCFELHEEWWLHENGSGRVKFEGTFPRLLIESQGGQSLIKEKLTHYLAEIPTVRHSRIHLRQHGQEVAVRVDVKFDSIRDLFSTPPPPVAGKDQRSLRQLRSFAGAMDFDISGRRVHVNRTILLGKAIPGARWIPPSQLKDRKISYRLHLPVAPEASNATRREDFGQTLIWEYSLAEALKHPITTQFELLMPVPLWLKWLAGSLGALAVILVTAWVFRKKTTRSAR